MAEHASSMRRMIKGELISKRQRMEAAATDMALLMGGAQLSLKQSRALLLVPVARPQFIASASPAQPSAPHHEPGASPMSLGTWPGWPASTSDPET